MCGIVGAINGQSVVKQLLTGLGRLEYRGYDSAGLATVGLSGLEARRAEGKIINLREELSNAPVDGHIGIAHTRWATHGAPSERNAHPHLTERVAVVHNGIVENYHDLRAELIEDGHVFHSETDSEVVPIMISALVAAGASPEEATFETLQRLEGAYALGILFAGVEDRLIAARRGSPLVLGLGDKANYIASDGMALAGMAEQIVYLEDGDWATVSGKEIEIRDAHGALVRRPARTTPRRAAIAGKGGYRHFMKKEIHEQPRVIRETLSQYLQPAATGIYLENLPLDFADVNRLQIVACGTSYHAGMITRYWAEKYARLPVDVETASEFCYREPVLAENGVSLFISQSGETADTLSALRYAKAAGQKIVALVNTPESTMAREADIVLHTLAGPEIGVASTKAFTTQLSVLACLTIAAGRQRGALDAEQASRLVTALNTLPCMIESVSADDAPYLHAAGTMRDTVSAIFVGRGSAYPTAIEGALKLKEISYIHAEGLGAGELKHGPIALVDATMPVVVIAPPDELFAKTHSNLREISARGANILLVSTENGIEKVGADAANTLMVPDCDPFVAPILYSVPLQLLSYHVASLKGTDIDQPRNLAKSVTVE